jgi:hypothetical protein
MTACGGDDITLLVANLVEGNIVARPTGGVLYDLAERLRIDQRSHRNLVEHYNRKGHGY